jgi:hypothetical protein
LAVSDILGDSFLRTFFFWSSPSIFGGCRQYAFENIHMYVFGGEGAAGFVFLVAILWVGLLPFHQL